MHDRSDAGHLSDKGLRRAQTAGRSEAQVSQFRQVKIEEVYGRPAPARRAGTSLSIRSCFRLVVAVLSILLLAPLSVSAQESSEDGDGDSDSPWDGVEELVVVGHGAAALIVKEGNSVIAFDAEEISARGFSDISDLSSFTPNLEIKTAFAGANPTLFIRGVGLNDYLSNAQSSVAVYNDGVYMQSPTGMLFQLFDNENVEVLRGPQGSIFGRNATAGAILVSSRKPSGDFGAYSTTTYGRFNQIEQEAAIEFPVVSDRLSARISARFNRRDGIARNRCATPQVYDLSLPAPNRERVAFRACTAEADPSPQALERNINDIDNWAARGILQLETTSSTWTLNVHGGGSRALATQFQKIGRNPQLNTNPPGFVDSQRYVDIDLAGLTYDPTDGDPYAGDYNRTGDDNIDLFGASLTATWDFDELIVSSITAIEENEREAETDSDASPSIVAEIDFNNKSTQVSQALRADWTHPDLPLTLVAGGLALWEELEARNLFRLNRTQQTVNGRSQNFDQTTWSWGVYADLSWDAFESITIQGGIRYNWDFKEFRLQSCAFQEPFRLPGPRVIDCAPPFVVEGTSEETWTSFTGEARITYHPTEAFSFYLLYSHGWKPGQFNGSSFAAQFDVGLPPGDPLVPDVLNPAKPESVDSFEIGLSLKTWDDRVSLRAAGFVYRYEDLQVFRLRNVAGSPPINELINANDAQIAGVEIEIETELLDNLFVNASFGWLYSRYNSFSQSTRRQLIGVFPPAFVSSVQDYSGSRLIASPEFTFSGSAYYDLDLRGMGTLTPRVDFTWRSEIFFDPNEGRGYFDRQGEFLPKGTLGDDALPLVHVRLSYKVPDDSIEISGWMRNVADEEYKLDAFDVSNGFQGLIFVIGQPRTYGLTMTVRF